LTGKKYPGLVKHPLCKARTVESGGRLKKRQSGIQANISAAGQKLQRAA